MVRAGKGKDELDLVEKPCLREHVQRVMNRKGIVHDVLMRKVIHDFTLADA